MYPLRKKKHKAVRTPAPLQDMMRLALRPPPPPPARHNCVLHRGSPDWFGLESDRVRLGRRRDYFGLGLGRGPIGR